MRTLNLSGFNTGDNLTLSVSQGALTAGPINVPSWGGAVPSGNITIQTHRSHMQVAPDSVRFWVDLSGSDFDTAGPGAGEVYDARLHDLIYLWDFNDPGTWTAPENVFPAWKNRSTAKGPFVMHMYANPGTYSPSVLVIEPSSGKTAVAVLDGANAITVLNPDDVYPGAATICVNPVGDNDFSAKPAGALEVNSNGLDFQQAPWTSHLGGVAKRWLFKRGGYFEQRLNLGSNTTRGVYFGAYGSGAKPEIANAPYVGDPYDPQFHLPFDLPFGIEQFGNDGGSVAADIRFVHLHGFGTYDPVTTRSDYRVIESKTANWMFNLSSGNLIMHECDFSGLQGSFLYNSISDATRSKEHVVHINHCTMTAFGGQYPIFTGQSNNARSAVGITGCRFAQTPGAVGSDSQMAGSSRAIIRSNSPHRFHMRGCDFYHTDQWQHCAKVPETPSERGVVVNIHSCSFEGGCGALVFNGNYTQSLLGPNSQVQNIIVDGTATFSNHSTYVPFKAICTGVTMRNNLLVTPRINRVFEPQKGFLTVEARGTFDPVMVGAAPIRLYNNTYVNERDPSNFNGSDEPAMMVDYTYETDAFTNIDYLNGNNVIHKPNFASPVTTFAPLSSAQLFPHRDLGYRNTDPGFGYLWPTAITVANGASHVLPYGIAHRDMPITQANFSGSTGKEQVFANSKIYIAANGHFTVTYGATEITVTNTSGETWNPTPSGSGPFMWFQLDMGTTAPIGINSVPAPGAWKDTKPLPGSAALGAALSGNVSYMDILGTTRTAPADKGAWEVT